MALHTWLFDNKQYGLSTGVLVVLETLQAVIFILVGTIHSIRIMKHCIKRNVALVSQVAYFRGLSFCLFGVLFSWSSPISSTSTISSLQIREQELSSNNFPLLKCLHSTHSLREEKHTLVHYIMTKVAMTLYVKAHFFMVQASGQVGHLSHVAP